MTTTIFFLHRHDFKIRKVVDVSCIHYGVKLSTTYTLIALSQRLSQVCIDHDCARASTVKGLYRPLEWSIFRGRRCGKDFTPRRWSEVTFGEHCQGQSDHVKIGERDCKVGFNLFPLSQGVMHFRAVLGRATWKLL